MVLILPCLHFNTGFTSGTSPLMIISVNFLTDLPKISANTEVSFILAAVINYEFHIRNV